MIAPSGAIELPDGGRLSYGIAAGPGGGRDVLLLRPLGGAVGSWGPFAERVAATARVVVYDHRGAGESSRAPLRTTTRGMARDAVALLDALGIGSVDAVGVSLGGMVATWLAVDAPERVRRLVLVSTLARGVAMSAHGVVRAAREAACFVLPRREIEPCLVRRVLSRPFRDRHADEVASLEASVRGHPASRRDLALLAGAAARHDARGVLGRIRAPTLVLAGELDHLVGLAAQRALAEAIADSRFEAIRGAGHALTIERPLAAADRVLAFLDAAE